MFSLFIGEMRGEKLVLSICHVIFVAYKMLFMYVLDGLCATKVKEETNMKVCEGGLCTLQLVQVKTNVSTMTRVNDS